MNFSLDGDPEPVPVVSRDEWGALPPSVTKTLSTPITNVIFTYYTDTKHKSFGVCKNPEDCVKLVQEMQKYYLTVKKCYDIPYNFLVGGDGRVYEGRGWNVKPKRNKAWHNLFGRSMEIAYIGDYHEKRPPKKMWNLAWNFCDWAMSANLLDDDFEFIENYDEKKLDELHALKPWYEQTFSNY